MNNSQQEHGLAKFTMGIGPLLICAFGVTVSNSMIFAALSDLQDKYGFSASGLGFISAAGFMTSFIVQLVVAPFADRGAPKRLVLAALVLAFLGSVLFAFGNNLWIFVVARALTGASLGTSGPAIKAIAANMDKNRSAERLGRLRGIELAGFTGGPLIGALLIGPFGLRGAFLIFGVIAMIAFVIVAPKDLPRLPTTNESRRPSYELLRIRAVRASVLASLTLFIPVGIYDSLWDRYVTDRGGNNVMVGMTFLLYTIPFIVLGAAGGRLSDRRGPARMTVIGIFCTVPPCTCVRVLTQCVAPRWFCSCRGNHWSIVDTCNAIAYGIRCTEGSCKCSTRFEWKRRLAGRHDYVFYCASALRLVWTRCNIWIRRRIDDDMRNGRGPHVENHDRYQYF